MSFIRDIFGGGAERDAAQARERGITEGIDEQRRQFDLTRSDFQPEVDAGNTARNRLMDFLGLNGADAEGAAIAGFNESPGQAFLRKRAERSLLRNSSATGGLKGGNVLTALQEQGIGIAAGQLGERKDRLAGIAGSGSGANVARASIGSGISRNISDLSVNRGDARGSGIEAVADRRRNTIGRVAGMFA